MDTKNIVNGVPFNCRPIGMSEGVNEESAVNRDPSIYLDFPGENGEKPATGDEIGQVNKSFGKLASY